MAVASETINLTTEGTCDVVVITEQVASIVKSSDITRGVATVFVPGATGALTTMEPEDGAIQDLKDAIERIAPAGGVYKHNEAYGDGNGFSHVRAALLGPSLSIPFEQDGLVLGTWQHIIFIDFDNRPRSRSLIVQMVGDSHGR